MKTSSRFPRAPRGRLSSPRRPSLSGLAALLVAALAACDADRAPNEGGEWLGVAEAPPSSAGGEGGGGGEDADSSGAGILEGPCTRGEARACKGPAPHCFVGRQTCEDGTWSICTLVMGDDRQGSGGAAGDEASGGSGGAR